MERIYKQLQDSALFEGFKVNEIESLLKEHHYISKKFSKDQVVAIEGDAIKTLGIILSGEVAVKKVYETGKTLQVRSLKKGDLIGNPTVFADCNYYPSTIICKTVTEILFVSQKDIGDMCMAHRGFFENFVKILSNQVIYLSEKVKFISFGTIRKKITHYLLTEYKRQNDKMVKVAVRTKMAEMFGVSRPALSNELIRMKADGLIEYNKDYIKILDVDKIELELEK
ncbi:Crp/Fnr family transcriptional regulator [Vallitalea okinawensis]|uniref:Crp/Fnr family transcriptional regulator n=1 Tax=Vallitalea okinawensis TaxID=2078660 RepID=UPI000CFCDA17|nr:Crp/Fnr family transcriptional regulator [Vallitalea okinawensis]